MARPRYRDERHVVPRFPTTFALQSQGPSRSRSTICRPRHCTSVARSRGGACDADVSKRCGDCCATVRYERGAAVLTLIAKRLLRGTRTWLHQVAIISRIDYV